MRANLLDLTQAALAAGRAVPAISVYDFTTAQGIVMASEGSDRPVILLVPPKVAGGRVGSRFIAALRVLADASDVPVCVQLDHAKDLSLIRDAVLAGADSALADGSSLGFEENAELVRQARALVGPGVVLEAELGSLPGDEDRANLAADPAGAPGLTDPARVAEFLRASGADLLAVAVGNVHGRYKGEPKLDWGRLGDIRAAAKTTPLVLHGASGIPQEDIQRVGRAGIGKVNINTELRTRIFGLFEGSLAAFAADGVNLLDLTTAWTDTVDSFVTEIHSMSR